MWGLSLSGWSETALTFSIFFCPIERINPHHQLVFRRRERERERPRVKTERGYCMCHHDCWNTGVLLTSSSVSSLYSGGHFFWRISSFWPFSTRSSLTSSHGSSWFNQRNVKPSFVIHRINLKSWSNLKIELEIEWFTSSPIMVILGKRLDNEAQMLCCASLSASVCRSLAPVWERRSWLEVRQLG